ncbi:MAG: TIGR01777 family oxidoreductase [Thermodesulfobacteriota bacterium]
MNVFVTGGTGFVGSFLVRRLVDAGHRVTILSRRQMADTVSPAVAFVSGDPTLPGPWQGVMAAHDAVINLAGRSIFCRWTEANRRAIRESRTRTTANIAGVLAPLPGKVLINASAVGYYGDCGDLEVDEDAPAGDDFLAHLARAWEAEAVRAGQGGSRVVLCRFGVVLGRDGGALATMLPGFRLGVASPLGNGRQWFPWIHLEDLARVILFCLDQEGMSGPVNCTAPQPVTNRGFTVALARALGKRVLLPPVPAFLLRLLLGELAGVLLSGQKVRPARLLAAGFTFRYPDIESCLRSLVGKA